MKFVTGSPIADPDAAARKLVEIANAIEAVQDGRIHVELINAPFLDAGGSPAEYRAEVRVEHRRLRPRCAGRLAPTKLPITSSASLRRWSPVASRCLQRLAHRSRT